VTKENFSIFFLLVITTNQNMVPQLTQHYSEGCTVKAQTNPINYPSNTFQLEPLFHHHKTYSLYMTKVSLHTLIATSFNFSLEQHIFNEEGKNTKMQFYALTVSILALLNLYIIGIQIRMWFISSWCLTPQEWCISLCLCEEEDPKTKKTKN
jgi:hypothetical protein